jgi:hypothetical protein
MEHFIKTVLFILIPLFHAVFVNAAGTGPADIALSSRTTTSPATDPAAEAALPAQPPPYAGEIQSALNRLSALLSKGRLMDQNELARTVKEITALDARIAALLGPALVRELEEQEKERWAKAELLNLRSLMLAYYGDNEGKYPASPADLAPRYFPAVPLTEPPRHAATNAVALYGEAAGGPEKAVTDAGGWLYFSNPRSRYFGMVILNCSHKDTSGNEFYSY